MLTSYDFSLIAVVCTEAVPDPALVLAGRDLEELQRAQRVREYSSNGSLCVCSIPCVLLARCWLGIL